MWVRIYQDQYLSSVRVYCDKVIADGDRLQFFHAGQFVGSAYFNNKQDCHHIEVTR
jgi:hypothetical protein